MLNDMMLCEELFHTPTGVAFADFITEGHRETWPIRSKRFRTWMQRCYYQATGAPRAQRRSGQRSICSKRARSLMLPSGQSISASPSMPAAFISILLMSTGVPLKLDLTAGEYLNLRLFGSVDPPACCRCRYRRAEGRLKLCARSSIFRVRTTLYWLSHGCWRQCDQPAPIRCWRYAANRARQRQSYQSSSGG